MIKLVKVPDEVKTEDIVKAVYRYSQPQGMGFMHFIDGDLDVGID